MRIIAITISSSTRVYPLELFMEVSRLEKTQIAGPLGPAIVYHHALSEGRVFFLLAVLAAGVGLITQACQLGDLRVVQGDLAGFVLAFLRFATTLDDELVDLVHQCVDELVFLGQLVFGLLLVPVEGEEGHRPDALVEALGVLVFPHLAAQAKVAVAIHTDVEIVQGHQELLALGLLVGGHQHHLGAEVHQDPRLITNVLALRVGTNHANIQETTVELCDLNHECNS